MRQQWCVLPHHARVRRRDTLSTAYMRRVEYLGFVWADYMNSGQRVLAATVS
jgi:hypothetical protein